VKYNAQSQEVSLKREKFDEFESSTSANSRRRPEEADHARAARAIPPAAASAVE